MKSSFTLKIELDQEVIENLTTEAINYANRQRITPGSAMWKNIAINRFKDLLKENKFFKVKHDNEN